MLNLWKRSFAVFVILLSIGFGKNVYAETYDGVWILPGGSYVQVDQSGNNFLAVHLPGNMGHWEAFYGTIAGNTAQVVLILSPVLTSFTATFTFTSLTTGLLRIDSCAPADSCLFKTGLNVNMVKIY